MAETPPQTDEGDSARLSAVLESISDGFYALDREWRVVIFNSAAETYFGVHRDMVLGKVLWDVFPQGLGTAFERHCRMAMEQKLTSSYEVPSRVHPDRMVELRIAPMSDGGVAVVLDDITDRHAAAEAARLAHARGSEILESISDAFYAVDGQWRFTYVNRQAEAWWARSREDLVGKNLWEEYPQFLGAPAEAALRKAAADREVVKLEMRSELADRWVDAVVCPTADGGLSIFLRDITDRKDAEAARELLMREVDHRARNVLSVVQSIIRLTSAPTLDAYKGQVLDRISALARAQKSLAERRWEGASLRTVIEEEMAALGEARAYSVKGPAMDLPPERVQPASMILHELATNARKYGAFSRDTGEVAVEWKIEPAALVLTWRETGGPPAAPPTRRGFGSRLIHDLAAQLGGEAEFLWSDEGLTFVFRLPFGGG
ncbi:MAG TPA: PAS domain-containing protein [Phenylobacterium sp.]|nr:PAS domain-containing protein [Phenylobacterium sp.]